MGFLASPGISCYSHPVMQTVLQVKNLSFGFDSNKNLLEDVSFSLKKGEMTLLAGSNGAGKSILMKILKGLLQCKSGEILVEGKDLSKKPKERLRSIGLVFQDADTQIVGQTVSKDILFGLENLDIPKREQEKRLKEMSTLLGLLPLLEHRPHTLSGGEQRRLAIAGVLVMHPSVLILDEPFANLDYHSIRQVIQSLLELKGQGVTILLVSHEAEKILAHCEKAMLLEKGRLLASGDSKDMLEVYRNHGIYIPRSCSLEELSWLHQ